jgi:hypothetical protein
MSATDYKGLIGLEDLNVGTGTFTRRTSTGELKTLTQIPLWDTGTEAPTEGYHEPPFVRWNSAPAAGGNAGWICITAGTPGTFKEFAPING